jgi:anti-sigma regulatory factor (Ser/Thr protein kinase)
MPSDAPAEVPPPGDPVLVDHVEVGLPEDARAAGVARRIVGSTLDRWNLGPLLDRTLLVVSELTSNAVRHGGPPVRLILQRFDSHLRVSLHDRASEPPRMAPAEVPTDATSGRGMVLVGATSDGNGVRQIPGDGKEVWAELKLDPDEQPDP